MTNKEIHDIFDKHVKSNYTKEYNNKNWKWENKDFPRIISLLEFDRYMRKYDFHFDNVLSFNGLGDPEYEYFKYNKRYDYQYKDDVEKYDLHNIDLDKKDFDFCMANQVL